MDCKLWISVADVPPGYWIAIAIAALTLLWIGLVVVKLWLTWGNIRDRENDLDPEPMEMERGDLHLVDLTSGEILGKRKRGKD